MDWPFFIALQTALIAVAVTAAFVFHNRKLNRQNLELRAFFTKLEEDGQLDSGDPTQWVTEHLEAISEEEDVKPLVKAVMENAVTPTDDFYSVTLPELARALVGGGDGASSEEVEALKAEIAELRESSESGGGPDDMMKMMLQQYTQDSRDMLSCIEKLEKENAELSAKLAEDDQEGEAA